LVLRGRVRVGVLAAAGPVPVPGVPRPDPVGVVPQVVLVPGMRGPGPGGQNWTLTRRRSGCKHPARDLRMFLVRPSDPGRHVRKLTLPSDKNQHRREL
jgi:hypothetical protein